MDDDDGGEGAGSVGDRGVQQKGSGSAFYVFDIAGEDGSGGCLRQQGGASEKQRESWATHVAIVSGAIRAAAPAQSRCPSGSWCAAGPIVCTGPGESEAT